MIMDSYPLRYRRTLPPLAIVLLSALLGALLTMAWLKRPQPPVAAPVMAQPNPTEVQASIVGAAHKIGPAVVNIDTMLRPNPFQDEDGQPPKGEGSGVIVSADGYILTNNHVVQGATEIQVTLPEPDGRKFTGTLKGADRLSDLAIVKIDAKDLPVATLGDSDKVPIGAFVIAVGNPFGFQHTVTMGVLSARGREIPEPGKEFRNLLQTDAAINPGNSGGPLVDIDGNVIGINTAIYRQAQGIGFAIPINTARDIMQQLISDGRVTRAYIGVLMAPLTPALARRLQVPSGTEGAVVRQVVEGSPAELAGLMPGDVLVEVDGKRTKTTSEVQSQIRAHKPGDAITLGVMRAASLQDVKLQVAEMPSR